MKGETHALIGTAAALAVVNPQLSSSFVLTCSFAFLGSLLPDVDTKASLIRKPQTYIILLMAWYFFIDYRTLFQSTYFKIGASAFVLLALYAAVKTSHRTFTHSFLALILFSSFVYIAYPMALGPFLTGYLAHMLADSLTVHGVPFLYPFVSHRFGPKFLSSGGSSETVLITLSCVLIVFKLFNASGLLNSINMFLNF